MGEIADWEVDRMIMGFSPVGSTTGRFNTSKPNKANTPKSEGKEMKIRKANQAVKNLNLGDVVEFPQYGTSYVVHNADSAAVQNYGMVTGNAFQLYRLDGQKPYRKIPFTGPELVNLVDNLQGRVYSINEYDLELVKR